jgi:gliding motility-associated-like protein
MYKKLFFTFFITWTIGLFAQSSVIQLTNLSSGTICSSGKDTVVFSVNYSGIPASSNIVFYQSTNPSFNPYAGQGDSIGFINVGSNTSNGTQLITSCPEIIGIFIDACDPDPLVEQDNEYIVITSGQGFLVKNLQVDVPSATNKDINIPLGSNLFGTPSAALMTQLRIGSCNASNLVAAGPSDSIPPNAIVIIFPSAPLLGGSVYNYNFSSYCSSGQPIYILQNSYHQPNGSFVNNAPNSCPGALRNTVIKNRTCTSTLTYDACTLPKFNAANPNANDGNFVVKLPNGVVSSTTNGGIKNNATDICNGLQFDSIVGATTIKFPIPNDGSNNPATNFCNTGMHYIKAITNPKGSQPISNTIQFQLICLDVTATALKSNICSDSNAVIKISSTDPNATFSWTVSGGANITGATAGSGNTIHQKLTNSGSAKDSVVYNITAKDGTCTKFTSVKIVVEKCNCTIPFSFGATSTAVCSGGNITLDASTNYDSYDWSTGEKTHKITVIQQGTYWVNVYKNGCKGTDTILVTKIDKPIKPNLGKDITFCGAFSQVLSTGDAQTDWYKDNVFISKGVSITATQTGTYIAKISNSCGAVADTIVLSASNNMSINIGKDTAICKGKTITLNATVSGSGITYLWNTGEKTAIISVSKAGKYDVVVTSGACVAYDTILIDIVNIPIKPNLGKDTTYCGAFSQVLSTGDAQTDWYKDNVFISKGVSITATQTGTYIAKISNSCGAVADTIVLSASNNMSINIGKDTAICKGKTITLNATVSGSGITYLWNTGEKTAIISVSKAGKYDVTVSNGVCTIYDTILIDILNIPTKPTLGKDTAFCGIFSYQIKTGDNGTVWNTGASGASLTVTQAGSYIAEIKNQCGSAKDTIVITQYASPKVDIGRDTTICDSIMLSVGNGNYVSIVWNTGEKTSSIMVNTTGIYVVTVSNTNCKKLDSIHVKKECLYDIYIPTAFSPNHDGVNDVFVPLSNEKGMYIIDFLIYNRWGEKIFESQDFTPNDITKGWNGTYKGQEAQVDNYAFYCSAKMPDGQIKIYKGTVALLR